MSERLLTVRDAAQYMGVKEKTVYAWVAAKRIRCLRAGSRLRFRQSDLDAWLGMERRE
jgi:excisionase family DNA binding protein